MISTFSSNINCLSQSGLLLIVHFQYTLYLLDMMVCNLLSLLYSRLTQMRIFYVNLYSFYGIHGRQEWLQVHRKTWTSWQIHHAAAAHSNNHLKALNKISTGVEIDNSPEGALLFAGTDQRHHMEQHQQQYIHNQGINSTNAGTSMHLQQMPDPSTGIICYTDASLNPPPPPPPPPPPRRRPPPHPNQKTSLPI